MENLLRAFERWQLANTAHDTAFKTYEGGSWGYHGSSLIEARNGAREDFKKEFEKEVDFRAEKVIRKLLSNSVILPPEEVIE